MQRYFLNLKQKWKEKETCIQNRIVNFKTKLLQLDFFSLSFVKDFFCFVFGNFVYTKRKSYEKKNVNKTYNKIIKK